MSILKSTGTFDFLILSRHFDKPKLSYKVQTLAFNGNEQILMSRPEDPLLYMYDYETKELQGTMSLPVKNSQIIAIKEMSEITGNSA